MGFYQSRKRGGNRKKGALFFESGLAVCAVFAHFREGLPAKQKRTPILIESTCVCRIGVARLELAASCSQSRRATNCATPRHPAAQLHRQNIVYRFLCGSSIQKSAADSAARVAFFSWRKRQPTTAEKHTVTGAFKGTGCGFGATAEKRMQKLGRVQNLLHSSCKKAEKVLS